MYNDPKLGPPVIFSILSSFLLFVGWRVAFPKEWEWFRLWLLMVGVILAGAAFWTGLDYLSLVLGHALERVRMGWITPQLRMAEIVSKMDAEQIKFMTEYRVVHGVVDVMPASLKFQYRTVWGDVDPDWLSEFLETAFVDFPEMPAMRHNSEGTLWRTNHERFMKWMEAWGLAERRVGKRHVWKASRKTVLSKLGLLE
jgi:hypothetical protein